MDKTLVEGEKYEVIYKFAGQIVFKVTFRGEKGLPEEELDGMLEEMAAIMKGERVGVVTEWVKEAIVAEDEIEEENL